MINEARATARTGKYLEALDKLQEVINLADESGQKLAGAIALNNVAEIHRLQGNTFEALNYYYQALKIYNEIGLRNGIAITGRRIDEILKRGETRGEKTTLRSTEPLVSENPAETRKRLINEAMERVRSRVRARQAKNEPGEPVLSPASGGTPISPQEPPRQSAKSEPPQDTAQLEYTAYLEQVKKGIVRAWKYPEQASQKREEGKVDVEFTILRDGRLENVRVLGSSGFPSLDREAIRAVRAASPFNPIPEGIALEQLSIRFTFNYNLEKTEGRPKKE
ncbi:MAG: TonB family protein [Candidatus Binatia bacterium]